MLAVLPVEKEGITVATTGADLEVETEEITEITVAVVVRVAEVEEITAEVVDMVEAAEDKRSVDVKREEKWCVV
jgi:hypothetical protein